MQKLQYIPLEKINVRKPVSRIPFIVRKVHDKIVLDLGALDETAYRQKQNTEFWLHQKISESAKQVFGIDNSVLLPEEGLKPFKNSIIYRSEVDNVSKIVNMVGDIEVIVAGELIEHLPNSLYFLQAIKGVRAWQGKELIITTPNASSLHNVLIGLFKRESTHIDHVSIYSYKTLHTLCRKAEFQAWEIIPYHVAFSEMILQSESLKRTIIRVFEKSVNVCEHIFPLLCGGWIVNITI